MIDVKPSALEGMRDGRFQRAEAACCHGPATGVNCFFKTADQNVMAVSDTAKGDSFEAGKLRVWTETRLREIAGFGNNDLAPDGKRLAAMVADDEVGGQKLPNHLTVLLNFFDELRRKVPAGK